MIARRAIVTLLVVGLSLAAGKPSWGKGADNLHNHKSGGHSPSGNNDIANMNIDFDNLSPMDCASYLCVSDAPLATEYIEAGCPGQFARFEHDPELELQTETSFSSMTSNLLESPELGPRAFGCNAWDDDLSWESECGLKKPGTTADDCTAATAATTAFNTEEYVDLLDLGEEAKNTANDEAKILDDLLRLGLELGDLEDVFGNTDIDASRSEEVKVVEEYQDDGNGDEETGQSEPVVYAGPELMKDDAEELLLGADLQDALLALPKDLAEEQDDDESAREPTTTPLAITDEKALLPPPKPSLAPPQVSPETTAASPSVAPDMTLGDTAVDNDHAAHCASMEHSDAEILNVDALDAGNAAAGALIPTTTIPVTGAAACGVERGATVSSSTGAVSGDTKNALESDCSSSSGGGASSSYNFEDIDVSSAIAAPPGVPIHLLDAVDLWESANAQKKNSAGEAKKSHGKKKNEFGKRRRSSGAGGHAPGPGLALDPPSGASSSLAAGRGRRVKKDPLAAVKDVRNLSRKPLIVQWLRSDGCELDPEAESTVGNAVGKLSMIHSHYWSGGG